MRSEQILTHGDNHRSKLAKIKCDRHVILYFCEKHRVIMTQNAPAAVLYKLQTVIFDVMDSWTIVHVSSSMNMLHAFLLISGSVTANNIVENKKRCPSRKKRRSPTFSSSTFYVTLAYAAHVFPSTMTYNTQLLFPHITHIDIEL